MTQQSSYRAKDIEILEGLEAVRLRPGMYIGSTGKQGLHHLLWEILDNAVDEAMNGYASKIEVILHADLHEVTVRDNGRGIPVDEHPVAQKSVLEVILTQLHAGGKFNQDNYKTSGGLHGVGSSVVNALSSAFYVCVYRDGGKFEQRYSRGEPLYSVRRLGNSRKRGTMIRFRPDEDIFGSRTFDSEIIADTLESKAYLMAGLTFVFVDEYNQQKTSYCFEGGLSDMVEHIADSQPRIGKILNPEIFAISKEEPEIGRYDMALAWYDGGKEALHSFTNAIRTSDGGTHEQGMREGVVRALRSYMEKHELIPRGVNPIAEDMREGLIAVISLFIADPQFQGQTKTRLGNPDIKPWIANHVKNELELFLNSHPSSGQAIVARVILNARARQASRQAALKVTQNARSSQKLNLPGKLADCSSKNPDECELFIVEGDSAGGSAKQGRDRKTQAILPLRGKVLNTESAATSKVIKNKELADIANAIGCGFGKECDPEKARYHKIILLMDADSDGHHICTLLLTFFYRHMRPLVDAGFVFLAQPPLYRIDIGKKTHWVLDDNEAKVLLKKNRKNQKVQITRFKGLGEMMPKTLFETTLDPKSRKLLRVMVSEPQRQQTDETLANLMGKDAKPRYDFIMSSAEMADNIDI